MGALRGAIVGSLGLIVLEAALTAPRSISELTASIAGSGTQPGLIGRLLSPAVPLIPDRRKHSSSSSGVLGTLGGVGGIVQDVIPGGAFAGVLTGGFPNPF